MIHVSDRGATVATISFPGDREDAALPHFGRGEAGFTKEVAQLLAGHVTRLVANRYVAEMGEEPYSRCYPVKVTDAMPASGRTWYLYTKRQLAQWLTGVAAESGR
jgi:hypothetical protein